MQIQSIEDKIEGFLDKKFRNHMMTE